MNKNGLVLDSNFDYRVFIGPPVQNTFKRLFPWLNDEDIKRVSLDFRNHYKDEDLFKAIPYPYLYDVLDEAKKNNVDVSVATFKREDYAYDIVDHFGVTKYTKNIHGQDFEGKRNKADIVALTIEESGYTKDECLMIGDTDSDGNAARDVGIDFLEVLFGFGFSKDKHYSGPYVGSIDSYKDLIEMIKE